MTTDPAFAAIDVLDAPEWWLNTNAGIQKSFLIIGAALPFTEAERRLLDWLTLQCYGTPALTADGLPDTKAGPWPRKCVAFWMSQPAEAIRLDRHAVAKALRGLTDAQVVELVHQGRRSARGTAAETTMVRLEVDPTLWNIDFFLQRNGRRRLAGVELMLTRPSLSDQVRAEWQRKFE